MQHPLVKPAAAHVVGGDVGPAGDVVVHAGREKGMLVIYYSSKAL